MKVACLTHDNPRGYRRIAKAMCEGILKCGDDAEIYDLNNRRVQADVGVMYGWKHVDKIQRFGHYVYADLGYWRREQYYRISVDGWSPQDYVMQGKDSTRLESFGVQMQPWNEQGEDIVIAGSTPKSCRDRGIAYMSWEHSMAQRILAWFPNEKVVYRPKPKDHSKMPLMLGIGYDLLPLEESLQRAKVVVTHHSNVSVDALVTGVPTYCEIGAAAACSITLNDIPNPPRLKHREQFLNDAAWLQWSLDEMRSGECWMHLKERGLLC